MKGEKYLKIRIEIHYSKSFNIAGIWNTEQSPNTAARVQQPGI